MQKRVIAGMGMIQWNLTISIKIIYCKEIEIRKWQLGLPAPRSSVEELLKCYYSTPWQGHSSEGCCLSVGSINKYSFFIENERMIVVPFKESYVLTYHSAKRFQTNVRSRFSNSLLFSCLEIDHNLK